MDGWLTLIQLAPQALTLPATLCMLCVQRMKEEAARLAKCQFGPEMLQVRR